VCAPHMGWTISAPATPAALAVACSFSYVAASDSSGGGATAHGYGAAPSDHTWRNKVGSRETREPLSPAGEMRTGSTHMHSAVDDGHRGGRRHRGGQRRHPTDRAGGREEAHRMGDKFGPRPGLGLWDAEAGIVGTRGAACPFELLTDSCQQRNPLKASAPCTIRAPCAIATGYLNFELGQSRCAVAVRRINIKKMRHRINCNCVCASCICVGVECVHPRP
jgi:hypothetical protein